MTALAVKIVLAWLLILAAIVARRYVVTRGRDARDYERAVSALARDDDASRDARAGRPAPEAGRDGSHD